MRRLIETLQVTDRHPTIAEAAPHLIREWHPTGNLPRTPENTEARSREVTYWVCEAEGHIWDETPEVRWRYGSGCALCASKRIRPGVNDLVTVDPEMAAEWDYDANPGVKPEYVGPGSKDEYNWKPACGHRFPRTAALRRQDRRCPVCVARFVYPGQNDVASQRPDLAALMLEVDPAEVTIRSRKSVKWQRSCGHTFTQKVSERIDSVIPAKCRRCGSVDV